MAAAHPHDPAALAWRVDSLEKNEVRMADKLGRVDDKVDDLERAKATFTEQIGGLSRSVTGLQDSLNKVLWALVTLALTIAGSAVGVMLTLGGH